MTARTSRPIIPVLVRTKSEHITAKTSALKRARVAAGLDLEQVAKRIGRKPGTIRFYETPCNRQKLPVTLAKRFSRIYSVSPIDFYARPEQQKSTRRNIETETQGQQERSDGIRSAK